MRDFSTQTIPQVYETPETHVCRNPYHFPYESRDSYGNGMGPAVWVAGGPTCLEVSGIFPLRVLVLAILNLRFCWRFWGNTMIFFRDHWLDVVDRDQPIILKCYPIWNHYSFGSRKAIIILKNLAFWIHKKNHLKKKNINANHKKSY